MPGYVALVRNVMVGRQGLHRQVLLDLLAAAGASDPRSHLATGNLTFTAPARSAPRIIAHLEAGVAEVIGRTEPVVARSDDELADLVAADPFAGYDPSRHELEVAFLDRRSPPFPPVEAGQRGAVVVAVRPHELCLAGDRTVANRAHANWLAERVQPARATSRAWSTVLRLDAELTRRRA